jgi:hypothetical protein
MDPDMKKKQIESIQNFHKHMQSMLPEEDRIKFQKLGEKLYNNFDIQKGTVFKENENNTLEEALAYIVEGLKSGLHPRHLDEDEIHLLRAAYGDEWYTKWNYTKEDLVYK